jgi:hypothetical protein
MSGVTNKPKVAQDPKSGRFLPGNNGGTGRPRGSRVKLEEEFVADLCAAWQVHGKQALEIVATKEPTKFAQICASVLPKHSHHTVEKLELKSDAELAAIIQAGLGARSLPNRTMPDTKLN